MSILPDAPRIADRAHGRDNHFNLIRMIAASGVLVSHAYPIALGPEAVQPLKPLLGETLGTVCVYVFFAISGFFIAKSFDRSQSRRRFLEARALRLFPALIVVLVLTVLVAGLFLTKAPAAVFWADVPIYLIRNLTLVSLDYDLPGVFEDTPYGPPINGSLWTLFHEVVCYAGVFLAGMLGLLRAPRLFAVAFVPVLVACFAIPALPVHPKILALASLALPFAIGTAFYVWRTHVPLHWGLAIGLVGLAWLAIGTPAFRPLFVLSLSYGVFWLGLGRAPALLAYNRLGDYSYGVYIYAFPLQQLAASMGAQTPLENMVAAFPATLVCAVLSWHLVEKPALSFVRLDKPADPAARKGMT
jgi:peptidoglycan/LPS O-acetylase OafA/YrhL